MAKVSPAKQKKALALVAEWMATKGYGTACGVCADCVAGKSYLCGGPYGPAPTGEQAAYEGLGPMLNPEWDWPSGGPTPTIILEGGPDEWAYYAGEALAEKFKALGIWSEPYASYALCLYPL